MLTSKLLDSKTRGAATFCIHAKIVLSGFIVVYNPLGSQERTLKKATPPGVEFQPVPITPVLKSLLKALDPIVPTAERFTIWFGHIEVLSEIKSTVHPEVVFAKVETVPTHPVDCEAPEFVNLKVKAPVALFAQKIPGFNSACTTPPKAGCPVL